MRLALAAAALTGSLVIAGCGGDSTAPSGPVSIGGIWSLSANISNQPLATSCQASGTITVNQSGTSFSGTTTGTTVCTGPGGTQTGSAAGTVSGGQISGSSISFIDDSGCNYQGTVSGNPANRVQGSVTCTLAINGTAYQFTGTWQASR